MKSISSAMTAIVRAARAVLARGPHLAIRGWLFIAFGVVAGTTVLASSIALVSYSRLGATLSAITTDSIPAMRDSLRVAKESAEIAAAAPALLAATRADETGSAQAVLAAKQEQLGRAIATVGAVSGTEIAKTL